MLVPIQAKTRFPIPQPLTGASLEEAVTAFNSELSQTFQTAGQVIGLIPAGLSNLLKLDIGGSSITVTVTLAVLPAADQPSVEQLADDFTSLRYPETTFSIVTPEQMHRLRGLRDFASTNASAHEHAADRINDIASDT